MNELVKYTEYTSVQHGKDGMGRIYLLRNVPVLR